MTSKGRRFADLLQQHGAALTRIAGREEVDRLFAALRALSVPQRQLRERLTDSAVETDPGGITNDEEWRRWASTYAREQRPTPPVVGRARTDRKRARVALAVVYGIAVVLALAAVDALARAHDRVAIASSVLMLLFVLVLVIGAHAATRGTFASAAGAAPPDLLADVERRHAGPRADRAGPP